MNNSLLISSSPVLLTDKNHSVNKKNVESIYIVFSAYIAMMMTMTMMLTTMMMMVMTMTMTMIGIISILMMSLLYIVHCYTVLSMPGDTRCWWI